MRRPTFRTSRARAALVAAAVVALLASGGTALPAVAAGAPVVSGLRLAGGDRTITAAWDPAAGASRYTVRISDKRSMQKARTVSTATPTTRITGLRNNTPYWVEVTSNSTVPRTTAAGARASVARATAAAGVPTPIGTVTAVPGAQPHQIQVSWTGGDRAVKVGVIAGSNIVATERPFHSPWYPATTRSITLTVPEQYRSAMGAGTGSPIYIRVVQSNSGSQRFHPTFDLADRYRASPVGSWSLAKAADPAATAVTKLRVAELNTQTNGATDRYSRENQWISRAPRVAALVESTAPDLFLTAELSTNADKYDSGTCHNAAVAPYRCGYLTQYLQLAKRLQGGLTLADPDAYARVMDQMKGFGGNRFNGKVTNGAHVFYNPATLTLLDHGFFSPALQPSESFSNVTGLGVPAWTSAIGGDRWLTWAKLRTNDAAQRVFYAVAAHLPVGDDPATISARATEAGLAEAAISRMAGGLPIVFGGDFNSDPTRNPNTAHGVFMNRGWFDSAATAARTNIRYNTVNGSGPQTGADPGYPLRPYLQKWPTSRIDYILLKNSPYTFRYENVLRRAADGGFDRSMQGSDHNLQLATIGIGDPVTTG